MNKDWPYNRTVLTYTVIYCCIALLIHFPLAGDHFAIPESRETLITTFILNSPTLAFQIAGYALAVLFINLLPLLVQLASLRTLTPILHRYGLSTFPVFLLSTLSLWIAALAFNKLYFPHSSYGLLLHIDDPSRLHWLGVGSLIVYMLLGVAPAAWSLVVRIKAALLGTSLIMRTALGAFLALGLVKPVYTHWSMPGTPSRQPDIIVIGLDSVAPLHMQHHPGAMPVVEKLLAESTVFSNTITPLARTFPAWTSILTGKYPVHNGARFNLTDFDQVDTRVILPNILRMRGYTTIYAQDERKFNNLDESFGFDNVIGPRVGAAEFVLTKASDHPLANLSLLTAWGKALFPFIALNRADYTHYDPDEFVTSIIDNLPEKTDKPLFLAAHFCLAHYPYTWRTQSRHDEDGTTLSIDEQHVRALGSLDRQIGKLIQSLRASGRLDNAILVILSDHGESLGYADGHWVSLEGHKNSHDAYEKDGYIAFPVAGGFSGHGTDTLDRSQYQPLLAFKGFGSQQTRFPATSNNRISSLVDIMPTLLNTIGIEAPQNIDGVDLLSPATHLSPRTVTAETGIRFGSLSSTISFDEDKLLQESSKYYTVEPESARLILKSNHYAEIVATKDIAIHSDDWILALLRKNHNPIFPRVAVLVYKPTGAWTTGKDLSLIQRAPMAALTQGLRQIYGSEIADFETLWPFSPSTDKLIAESRKATINATIN